MDEKKIAVLIDADNVSHIVAQALFENVVKYGRPTVRKIYGDWSKNPQGWKNEILEFALVPVQQFAYTINKNATDMSLVIDAMDLLHGGNLDAFCLVSSDSDFTPLVLRLKQSGVKIYGFGAKNTPNALVKACDEFTYFEDIVENYKSHQNYKPLYRNMYSGMAYQKHKTIIPVEIKQLIYQAINLYSNYTGWADVAQIGAYLKSVRPDFSYLTYGFTKISEMLRSFNNLQLRTEDNLKMSCRRIHFREVGIIMAQEIFPTYQDENGQVSIQQIENVVKEKWNWEEYDISSFMDLLKQLTNITFIGDDKIVLKENNAFFKESNSFSGDMPIHSVRLKVYEAINFYLANDEVYFDENNEQWIDTTHIEHYVRDRLPNLNYHNYGFSSFDEMLQSFYTLQLVTKDNKTLCRRIHFKEIGDIISEIFPQYQDENGQVSIQQIENVIKEKWNWEKYGFQTFMDLLKRLTNISIIDDDKIIKKVNHISIDQNVQNLIYSFVQKYADKTTGWTCVTRIGIELNNCIPDYKKRYGVAKLSHLLEQLPYLEFCQEELTQYCRIRSSASEPVDVQTIPSVETLEKTFENTIPFREVEKFLIDEVFPRYQNSNHIIEIDQIESVIKNEWDWERCGFNSFREFLQKLDVIKIIDDHSIRLKDEFLPPIVISISDDLDINDFTKGISVQNNLFE